MNIQELKIEKTALEKRLRNFISSELRRFQEDTDVEIERFSVDYTTVEAIGQKPRFLVLNTEVKIKI